MQLQSPDQFGIKELLAMGTRSNGAISGVEVELQNHFSPEIKAGLAQIVDRLVCDGFAALAFGLDNIEAVNQLAATDLEQRVTSALSQNLISLAKLINRFGILFLQIEQIGTMSEQRVVCLEQLAVDLSHLADHQIPFSQLEGCIANILSRSQGGDGRADE